MPFNRFEDKNNELSDEDLINAQRIVKEVVSVYEKETSITFAEAKSDEIPKFTIRLVDKLHPKIKSRVQGKRVIAYAVRHRGTDYCEIQIDGTVKLDYKVYFDSKPEDGYISVSTIISHVLGHCLGMRHG